MKIKAVLVEDKDLTMPIAVVISWLINDDAACALPIRTCLEPIAMGRALRWLRWHPSTNYTNVACLGHNTGMPELVVSTSTGHKPRRMVCWD